MATVLQPLSASLGEVATASTKLLGSLAQFLEQVTSLEQRLSDTLVPWPSITAWVEQPIFENWQLGWAVVGGARRVAVRRLGTEVVTALADAPATVQLPAVTAFPALATTIAQRVSSLAQEVEKGTADLRTFLSK